MKAEFKMIGRLKTIAFRVQKTEFRLITALFSRANFKASVEETLGAARPQTCARAVTALDPQLAILRCQDKQPSSA